jgi:DNA-binding transcriptional ArsR family regulator
MVNYTEATLDTTFSALSHPTRRAILARLADNEAAVLDLAEPFQISLPAILKHLKVLEQAGLITMQKRGRVRHCRIQALALQPAMEWLAYYQRFWDKRLDGLTAYLNSSK